MKPWQINILMLGGVIVVAIFLPTEIVKPLLGIMVFGSAIWAYIDSKKLGIEKYKKIALTPSTRSYGVFFIVWILWAIAFPMYISWRYRAINGRIPLKEVS
jgi:hypothetical protein